MRNIFAIFFAAILLYSSTLFAADNTISLEGEPYSSFLVGSTLYVISESSNRMYRVNTSNNKFLSSIRLDNGPTTGITYNGKIYITNTEDKTVSVFYNTGVYKTISIVGSGPLGIASIGTRLYVASFDDTLTVIDSLGDSRLDQISLRIGGTPTRHMTVTGNRIFLHHPATNSVSVFTTSGNKILKNFTVGKSPQSSVLVGKSLYVINRDSNDVTVVNIDTYEITKTIPLGTGPTTGVLVDKKLYINNTGGTVSVIDTVTNTVKIEIPVGKNPVALLTKEKFVYSINHDSDSISVIDTQTDQVVQTFLTGQKPLSGLVVGNTLYINNSGEKTVSYFYTVPPVLGLFTSRAASGEYRQGDKLDIVASFNQKLAPGSTMTITLNNGATHTLSTVDGNFLSGIYTIGADQTVADLSVKQINSANIIGLYTTPGTNYTLPTGKNLGDLRNITIKSGISTGTSVCQNKGYYRICPTTRPASNIGEYQDGLVCEGIISESQADRNTKRITRSDILSIAVNMLRVPTEEMTEYSGSFQDIAEPMKPMLQIALDRGLVTNTLLFEPNKPVTRLEAYTLLMKSVCLVPTPTAGQNWTQAVHDTAYKAGITNKTLSRFKPSSTVTKKEVFIIASQLADWADTTGGCQPQSCSVN